MAGAPAAETEESLTLEQAAQRALDLTSEGLRPHRRRQSRRAGDPVFQERGLQADAGHAE